MVQMLTLRFYINKRDKNENNTDRKENIIKIFNNLNNKQFARRINTLFESARANFLT